MNKGVKIPAIGVPGLPGEKDWIVGSASPQIPYTIDCEDFSPFLPDFDNQFGKVDWQRCVSESYMHVVETRLNWALSAELFTKNQIDALTALGYIVNGKFKLSIRALAKMSGTDPTGNSQNAVAECARVQGLLPDSDWPSDPSMDWNQHYAAIPQNLLDKAKQFLKYVSLPYAWLIADTNSVVDYQTINQVVLKELKQSPVQFTCPLCPSYESRTNTSVCASCGLTEIIHAMMIYALQDDNGSLESKIRDSYPPYNITLANNYPKPYIMKIVATVLPDTTQSPAEDVAPVNETIMTSDASISTTAPHSFFEMIMVFLNMWGIPFTSKESGIMKSDSLIDKDSSMSPTIPISLIVNILALILPESWGVSSSAITITIQTLISIITGIVILVEHKKVSDIVGAAKAAGFQQPE